MKTPHPKLSLKDKHTFYLEQMKKLDDEKKLLKNHIRWLSSESDQVKDSDFYRYIAEQKEILKQKQVLREKYRLIVRRLKETIKNKNRHVNSGIL